MVASSGTFFQILDFAAKDTDHLVLYRGQLYLSAGGGAGEFRVQTSSSKVSMTKGELLVYFTPQGDTTQLVSLANEAAIENRYQPESRVKCRAGESSTLDLRTGRAFPDSPQVIKYMALKDHLAPLHLEDQDLSRIVKNAKARQTRVFAAVIEPTDQAVIEKGKEEEAALSEGRVPASVKKYQRHSVDSRDAALKAHHLNKVVGGVSDAETLAFSKRAQEEKVEKKKVLRELSSVRPEE
jgi:hypothetical protein